MRAIIISILWLAFLSAGIAQVPTDDSETRVAALFEKLGVATGWDISLEINDDPQTIKALVNKLYQGDFVASILKSEASGQTLAMALSNSHLFNAFMEIGPKRLLAVDCNIPCYQSGLSQNSEAFTMIDYFDIDEVPASGIHSSEDLASMRISINVPAKAFVQAAQRATSFKARFLTFRGTASQLSDPDSVVTDGSGLIASFFDQFMLTQKHGHLLWIAYSQYSANGMLATAPKVDFFITN